MLQLPILVFIFIFSSVFPSKKSSVSFSKRIKLVILLFILYSKNGNEKRLNASSKFDLPTLGLPINKFILLQLSNLTFLIDLKLEIQKPLIEKTFFDNFYIQTQSKPPINNFSS